MKLENLEKVEKLVKVRSRLYDAREACADFRSDKVDSGGVDGVLETGFNCFISAYSDGSGDNIDLTGCYIRNEIVDAVETVIQKKLVEVESVLAELGVDLKLTIKE